MENYTWSYIQKYPKQTKRLLGIDCEQLEQFIALGKLRERVTFANTQFWQLKHSDRNQGQ